jgi:hypothetical protein
MENKFSDIDDVFRNALSSMEIEPNPESWEKISSQLSQIENKKRFGTFFFWLGIISIVSAFTIGAFVPFANEIKPEKNISAENKQVQKQESATEENLNKQQAQNSENKTKAESKTAMPKSNESIEENKEAQFKNAQTKNKKSSQSGLINISKNNASLNVNMEEEDVVSEKNYTEEKSIISNTDQKSSNALMVSENKNSSSVVEKNEEENNTNNILEASKSADSARKEEKGTVTEESQAKSIDLYEGLESTASGFTQFSVQPFFSPMYVLRNSNGNDQSYASIGNSGGDFEQNPAFSYEAGVLLGYNFTSKISLHVGVSYHQMTHTTSPDHLFSTPFAQLGPLDTAVSLHSSAGELDGVTMLPNTTANPPSYQLSTDELLGSATTRISQIFSFIEVPVIAKYRFGKEKIGFTVGAGLSTGFLVRNEAHAESANGHVLFGQTKDIRNVNFNVLIQLGIDVRILPWMYLTLEPTFRYSLLDWNISDNVSMNPIFFGANTGLSFRF